MKILQYIKKQKYNNINIFNHTISSITDDSRKVKNNGVFVAIKGYKNDGFNFIDDAIKNGAKTIIYDKNVVIQQQVNINYIKVDNAKVELAKLLKWFYVKFKKPKVIAVTGTNGKTSTTSYLYQLFKLQNDNVLLFGTRYIKSYFDNKEQIDQTNNTTIDLATIYNKMYEHNYKYVILEASSQGIEEGRLLGLSFDIVCFTNITQDHLDYHRTIENYMFSKSKLIYMLKDDGVLLLNKNIKFFNYLSSISTNNLITYSTKDKGADFFASNIVCENNQTSFLYNKNKRVITSLIGKFNIENILACLGIMTILNQNIDVVISNLINLKVPKGRMNLYKVKDFYVLVDFAHTPDGVLQVLEELYNSSYNHIYTVIGAGGNKDQDKRPKMGLIASKYSTKVYFTEDNSREELFDNIIKDLTCKLKNNNYEIIQNRKDAILCALSVAEKNDIVAILGKGDEEFIVNDKIIPFSDLTFIESFGGVRLNE